MQDKIKQQTAHLIDDLYWCCHSADVQTTVALVRVAFGIRMLRKRWYTDHMPDTKGSLARKKYKIVKFIKVFERYTPFALTLLERILEKEPKYMSVLTLALKWGRGGSEWVKIHKAQHDLLSRVGR